MFVLPNAKVFSEFMTGLTMAVQWLDQAPEKSISAESFVGKLSASVNQSIRMPPNNDLTQNDVASLHNLLVILDEMTTRG